MTESQDNKIKDELIPKELLEKIRQGANYCYNCNRCVNVCPLSHVGIFNPRQLVNDLTFLSIEEAIQNNNIWDCLTCGQCTTYCPMSDDRAGVKIPEIILELRKLSTELGLELQCERCDACETHEGIFPLISDLMANNSLPPNKLGFLEGTDLKTTDSGEIAYFVGCLPILDDAIPYMDVDYVSTAKTIISILNEADITPVVLNEKCCGHDIYWGKGDTETFKKLAEYNVKLYRDAGVKTIIVSCAEGYRTWKIDYPKIIEDFDFEVFYFAEYLLQENIMDSMRFPHEEPVKVTYHDACRLGRLGGKLYDAPRDLLTMLPGVELIEMQNIKADATCCGVSAFCGCNEYTRLIRERRINEAIQTGAEYLVVSCPKCLTHFNCYLTEPGLSKKPDLKVIDLASFIGKLLLIS